MRSIKPVEYPRCQVRSFGPSRNGTNPTREESDNVPPLFHGVISGNRRRSHDEVAERADRIASGLHSLGVTPGDSVCMLLRNDIAFIEAAYAAMRLGAYGVPINWHFKPEEINYVLKNSGTRVLIAHADMLHGLRERVPRRRHRARVPTPPEILANYKIDPDHLGNTGFRDQLRNTGCNSFRAMTARSCRSRPT